MTQHRTMLRRNVVYTGVTLGKRLVVIVGQGRALGLAVKARPEGRRWSKLKEWLAGVSGYPGIADGHRQPK
jgi:exodeoxyribonuclease V alpha subunit